MAETYVGSVAVFLGDEPQEIATSYGASEPAGRPYAVLRIGGVSVHVKHSSPAALRKLASCAEELVLWLEQHPAEAEDGTP